MVLGKPLIRDDWITQSSKEKKLLDPTKYLLKDPQFEKKWGRNLADIPENPLPSLLEDKIIYVTPSLKKEYGSGFKDVEKIAIAAGATKVVSKQAKSIGAIVGKGDSVDDVIVLAAEDDQQAESLTESGVDCYGRDLLSSSIFAGKLEVDDENLKWAPKPKQKRLNRVGK